MAWLGARATAVVAMTALLGSAAAVEPPVKGTFLVQGEDAKLAHARASSASLDGGKPGQSGYIVLLSARPAEGDLQSWRSADPAERGSFICLLLERSGAVWVAELGHANSKTGRFGVVSELQGSEFSVSGDRIAGRVRTLREQTFDDDRYSVDLKFEATLEK